MFDFFRRHTKVLQFVLVLLIFPSFVVFGIQGYSRFAGGEQDSVAKVGGQSISQAEFDRALRERIEAARRQRPGVEPPLDVLRQSTLDGLIRDRVLLGAADEQHLVAGDERLKILFANEPEFAALRNPDGSLNREVLAGMGMTSETFVQRLRQDVARRQVAYGLVQSVIAPAAAASAAFDALYQQREIQVQRFDAKELAAKITPTDAELETYYKDPAHVALFRAPEQAQVEYVVLDLESLQKSVVVPEDDLRKYYSENIARYTVPEERRVSQILIAADKDAAPAERDKAKAKATALAAEARAAPGRFAELARKNSSDETTAKDGGQMEFFGRGSLLDLKPFEDAVFALKPGEIAGPVQTDFGYHVILLQEVRGGDKKSYESVRPELEKQLRNQLAQQRFSEAAVEFGNIVYEQPDSLKPVAERWKLPVQSAEHVTRSVEPKATGALANAAFVDALFSSDVVKSGHNTKAIDIGANQLAAGRIVKHEPAHGLGFAEVKAKVQTLVVAAQAAALAKKLGSERLAALRATPQTALAEATSTISRAAPKGVPPLVLDAVLKAPAAALPAFVGVDLGEQGYAVAKILRVAGRDPLAADSARTTTLYQQVWADAEEKAYYDVLKTRLKVSVAKKAASGVEAGSGELR